MLGVNKDSPLLSKDFKAYWLSHLLKIMNVPVCSQKEKRKIWKTDIKKRNLAIPNLKLSTCSITKSFYRTVTQEKNGSEGNKAHKKHAGVIKRTDEGAESPVGTNGMNIVVSAHEKQVSKGFDRNS